ncbi:hypothetical protein SEA_NYCEIRAE_44 [Gordonia phage Nyceirae]|uniref:Uncharacterized protein n=1 Tax=Gordonia phage Nyceirae TaxID=1887651 RepID=A0A1C9EI22_9CAUD|nr:hypothetical protein BIZ68_gp44 [Gordonia phage Nyceirae]AON97407.1 hypothetical protein SEA_NYCEIRAE_44 [Gordonia phage Nyceirae]
MGERHLKLVPPLLERVTDPATDLEDSLAHGAMMSRAASVIARRGGRLDITICDGEGVELDEDPASTLHREFMVRVTALFDNGVQVRRPFDDSTATTDILVGVCDPVSREEFLGDTRVPRISESLAVSDLLSQLTGVGAR